jgi:hypothetical protein
MLSVARVEPRPQTQLVESVTASPDLVNVLPQSQLAETHCAFAIRRWSGVVGDRAQTSPKEVVLIGCHHGRCGC